MVPHSRTEGFIVHWMFAARITGEATGPASGDAGRQEPHAVLHPKMLGGKRLVPSCIRRCLAARGSCCLASRDTRRQEARAALHLEMLDGERLVPPCIQRR